MESGGVVNPDQEDDVADDNAGRHEYECQSFGDIMLVERAVWYYSPGIRPGKSRSR